MTKRLVPISLCIAVLGLGTAIAGEYRARPGGHDRIAALERVAPKKRTNAQRLELMKAYYQGGRLEAASQQAQQILAADPDHAEAWLIQGDIWQEKGNPRQALGAYNRAASLAPQRADVQLRRGAALMALGKTSEADAAFALYQALSEVTSRTN